MSIGVSGGLPPLVAHLLGDITGFAASMGEADALAKGVTGNVGSSWEKAGKQMMGVGAGMIAVAGAIAIETMKSAAAFDNQMELVHTQAGASQKEVDSLQQSVLNLAGATGQGPEKLAEALFHVESVGYRGATAMSVLTQAANLAEVSGANLDDTTYGLTSVMQTFGARAQDAAKYAALFNATVGAGDMRMEDFAKAVGTGFYSTGQAFGMTAQSMSAGLAFMTDRGQGAQQAATNLRMTIALLAAPSLKATSILKGLGLTSEDVAAKQGNVAAVLKKSGVTYSQLADDLRKPDGFYVALTHLKTALEQSGLSADAADAQLSHAFGGGKSDSTILAMLNNLGTLQSKYEAIGSGMGKWGSTVADAAKQPAVEWKQFVATVQALGIELGNDLLPTGMQVIGWLKGVAQYAEQNSGVVKGLAIAIGVTLVAGLVLATAGAIAFAAATIEIWGPIALIIVGVMALVAAVVYLWTHWSQIWGWIVTKAHDVGGALANAWRGMVSDVNQKWDEIVQAVVGAWSRLTGWVSSAWHSVVDPIVHGWLSLQADTVHVWTAISGWFGHWWPLLLVIFMPYVALVVGLWNHFHVQVWNTAVKVWSAVAGWFRSTWSTVSHDAQSAWSTFFRVTVQPVENAATTVNGWITRMSQWVSSQVSHLVGWIVGVWWGLVAIFVNPVVSAYNGVVGWLGRIVQAFYSMVGQAWSWLSGTTQGFWNIGWNMVMGIVNGVESGGSSLLNSMEDIANNALSAAKSALGIQSPSRRFADEVGAWIPQGVAVGVTAHTGTALDSIRALGRSMVAVGKQAVSPSIDLAAGMASGSQFLTAQYQSSQTHQINLTLNSVATVDGKQLFKTTQTEALRYQRRNGQTAFQR